MNVKMRILNLGKPADVPKLNEAMAIELGAQMLGEGLMFTIAAGTMTFEYLRSSLKEREKEEGKELQFQSAINDISELQFVTEKQDAEIRHMTRLVYSLEQKLTEVVKSKEEASDSTTAKPKSAIQTAILDAKIGLGPGPKTK